MRVLFFDLDGTIIQSPVGVVKPRLARGGFERAVRATGFDALVCVGNAVEIIGFHRQMGRVVDGHEMILQLCQGAFEHEGWFRSAVTWVDEPRRRGRHLDLSQDWWYVDDLAPRYLSLEGMENCYRDQVGNRIFVPDPGGDGADIVDWLAGIVVEGPE